MNLNGASSVLVPLSDEAPIEGITSYVPIVRTYRYNDSDDGIAKYNTYGAPIQEFALGRIKTIDAVWEGVNNKRGGISEYTWKEEDNDTTFCYYNVTLDVTGEVPEGYEAVGFRAWRVCELAHEYVGYLSMQRYADRQNHARSESKGYMMEWNHDATGGYGTPTNIGVTLGSVEIAAPEGHEEIRGELSSTFGAPMLDGHMGKVGQISKLPLKFRVRMYYKKKTGNQVRRRVDGELDDTSKDYFVVEKDYEIVLSLDNVVTSVAGVNVVREVAGVTYFNTLGQMSMRPFSGVNIVVTRYTDGTTSTGKAVY